MTEWSPVGKHEQVRVPKTNFCHKSNSNSTKDKDKTDDVNNTITCWNI